MLERLCEDDVRWVEQKVGASLLGAYDLEDVSGRGESLESFLRPRAEAIPDNAPTRQTEFGDERLPSNEAVIQKLNDAYVNVIRELWAEDEIKLATAIAERDQRRAELDLARTELDHARAELEQVRAEFEQAWAEHNQARAERDQALTARNQARGERDRARAERDHAHRYPWKYLGVAWSQAKQRRSGRGS
ncbi:hypothetical protein [Defluviimonas salinarum]|uniref:hypothetical protein n=1 Tax=Defluviimonas salinarum TaxID=2992147 RepID=UPI00222EB6B1|nr:hypothetical protein [Defluviimonas salinarum]